MGSPTIFSGRRTKLLTADGLLRTDGGINDNDGVKNYIANGHAEVNATGWATYADVAGTSPVDGTGGAPSVTFTRTTSSPLSGQGSFLFTKGGAANLQGQGASYDFTIDAKDKAKVLQISIPYIISSGTFTPGVTGSSSSDVTIWIYDITNAVLIQPSSISFLSNSSTISDVLNTTFQTSYNSTSYRLILHIGSTTANNFVLMFDQIAVSPSQYVYGSPITDWVAWTPTGSWVSNTTYTGFKRQVGDSYEYQVYWTTSGAPTSATLTINISETIDTSKLLTTDADSPLPFGGGSLIDFGVQDYPATVTYNSTTSVKIRSLTTVTGSNPQPVQSGNVVNQAAPFTWGASDYGKVTFKVPIVGKSSSVQMSDQADTRIVAAIISGDPASATSGNPIIVPTVGYDSHGAYNSSTGRYTCPVPGIYKIFGALQSASSATTLTIYKNASTSALAGNLDSNGKATFAGAVNCIAGDIIDLRPGGTVDATSMTLNIERLSGPSSIAATESINARYNNSSTSISGQTTVVWTNKDFDTHGALSSGIFTLPSPGKYQVNSELFVTATFTAGNALDLIIQKNSVDYARNRIIAPTLSGGIQVGVSDIVYGNAGDTIRIQVSTAGASPSIVSSVIGNYVSIAKLGS